MPRLEAPTSGCIGVNPISLPLDGPVPSLLSGGGLGWGWFINDFITLPLIPSPRGRGNTSSRFIGTAGLSRLSRFFGDLSGVVHRRKYHNHISFSMSAISLAKSASVSSRAPKITYDLKSPSLSLISSLDSITSTDLPPELIP